MLSIEHKYTKKNNFYEVTSIFQKLEIKNTVMLFIIVTD